MAKPIIVNNEHNYTVPKLSSENKSKLFQKWKTTTNQILALRRLVEGVKDKNLEAILIFIDFNKPFNTKY